MVMRDLMFMSATLVGVLAVCCQCLDNLASANAQKAPLEAEDLST